MPKKKMQMLKRALTQTQVLEMILSSDPTQRLYEFPILAEVEEEIERMQRNIKKANHKTLYNLLDYLKIRNNLIELENAKQSPSSERNA